MKKISLHNCRIFRPILLWYRQLKKGKIYLHGWYYNIETGRICAYNPKKDMFEEFI